MSFKGFKHTEESKRKMSEANRGMSREGNKGRVVSVETRKRLSKASKGRKFTIETRKRMSEEQKGRKHSEETKRKISKAHKGLKQPEEAKRKLSEINKGKKHSERTKRKISETRTAKIASGEIIPHGKYFDTSIELAIEGELKKRGIDYKKQEHIRGVGLVDFLLPDLNIIIECDGNYWHSREGAKQKDIKRDRRSLCIHKYQTFRFTETQINKSPAACIDQIKQPPLVKKYVQ